MLICTPNSRWMSLDWARSRPRLYTRTMPVFCSVVPAATSRAEQGTQATPPTCSTLQTCRATTALQHREPGVGLLVGDDLRPGQRVRHHWAAL